VPPHRHQGCHQRLHSPASEPSDRATRWPPPTRRRRAGCHQVWCTRWYASPASAVPTACRRPSSTAGEVSRNLSCHHWLLSNALAFCPHPCIFQEDKVLTLISGFLELLNRSCCADQRYYVLVCNILWTMISESFFLNLICLFCFLYV
jgi:hypothetical protein